MRRHLGSHLFDGDVEALEHPRRQPLFLPEESEKNVLRAYVVVLESPGLVLRENDDLAGPLCKRSNTSPLPRSRLHSQPLDRETEGHLLIVPRWYRTDASVRPCSTVYRQIHYVTRLARMYRGFTGCPKAGRSPTVCTHGNGSDAFAPIGPYDLRLAAHGATDPTRRLRENVLELVFEVDGVPSYGRVTQAKEAASRSSWNQKRPRAPPRAFGTCSRLTTITPLF